MGINLNTQLSKLDALNGMASYIGIPPIQNTDEIALSPDFQLAELILDELVQEVCAHGMPCNTEFKYNMSPDGSNEIPLEPGMISVFPEDTYSEYVVEREGKLYDNNESTFSFTQDIPVTVFWLYDYEDLPQVVRKYVYIASAQNCCSTLQN